MLRWFDEVSSENNDVNEKVERKGLGRAERLLNPSAALTIKGVKENLVLFTPKCLPQLFLDKLI